MRMLPLSADRPLPLLIEPSTPSDRSVEALVAWCEAHRERIDARLLEHGALLFRGFEVGDAQAFEDVALRIAPNLKNQYLGTSPRNARTTYTFTASELPPHYPIMQHCEMSFLPSAPSRLLFCATVAPGCGGETPITDCRAVWRDLDPDVRARFAERGIRILRNYGPPGGGSALDPWQLKSWPEVFGTEDRDEVERIAAREDTRCVWREDGGLRLEREQPATIRHPQSGEEVWFNHTQVFHGEAARLEYRKIVDRQGGARALGTGLLLEALTTGKRALRSTDTYATHATYADGTEIPTRDIAHLLEVFWRHMVFPRWQQGDILLIDNFSTSHGRMPFSGPREILVAFTEGVRLSAAA